MSISIGLKRSKNYPIFFVDTLNAINVGLNQLIYRGLWMEFGSPQCEGFGFNKRMDNAWITHKTMHESSPIVYNVCKYVMLIKKRYLHEISLIRKVQILDFFTSSNSSSVILFITIRLYNAYVFHV